jgi:hypothetical protein
MTITFAQDQATRDAISQQVRDQINAARQEAQAAAKAGRSTGPSAPPLPGTEGITIQTIPIRSNDMPPRAMGFGIALIVTLAFVVVFLPISRAIARKADRRGDVPRIPAEITGQLAQLTQAVDAIALEVERISEGQRFTTRLLSEQQRGDQSKTILSPVPGGDRPSGS